MTEARPDYTNAQAFLAFTAIAEALRVYLKTGKTRTEPWTGEELRAFLSSAIKNTTCDAVAADVELGGKRVALHLLDSMFATAFEEPVTITYKRN